MIIFEDIAARRFVARLDPRVRLACVLVFAVVISLAERPGVLLGALLAGAGLLAVSGVHPGRAARRLGALNLFMLLLAATLPLSLPAPVALRRALLIAARANAVMLALVALLGSMEAPHLGFGLHGIGVPEKFAYLLLFMVRSIEIVHHEYHRLRDAMRLRGFRPRCDRHTFRTLGFLVAQLLVRSVARSERILEAMKCRGFRGRFHILSPCRIERGDVLFAAAAFCGIMLLAMMEWV